jgi:hypothetical protein
MAEDGYELLNSTGLDPENVASTPPLKLPCWGRNRQVKRPQGGVTTSTDVQFLTDLVAPVAQSPISPTTTALSSVAGACAIIASAPPMFFALSRALRTKKPQPPSNLSPSTVPRIQMTGDRIRK